MARLLIIGCSQRKRSDAGMLPAIDRYDGPAYKVLRKFFREQPDHDVRVIILSAEFGLIDSDCEIPLYDRKMNRHRAQELRESIAIRLNAILHQETWRCLGISLSRNYMIAVDSTDCANLVGSISVFIGGQGKKLQVLKAWLRGSSNVNK